MNRWEALIQSSGIPPEGINEVLEGWYAPRKDRILVLCRLLRGLEQSWPTSVDPLDRLRLGVYSPLQALVWECGRATRGQIEFEYPFLFSTIGLLVATLLGGFEATAEINPWPSRILRKSNVYRTMAQSIFQLREMREEGEPLSLEVRLPLKNVPGTSLSIKRLAQVFGRGVGISRGLKLARRESPEGGVESVFRSHDDAPMTTLYQLGASFPHVGEGDLSLVLRRDGHLTLAAQRNPLLEFYDGGWHAVDIQSGRAALDLLLNEFFAGNGVPDNLADYMIRLAHHLGTHWHGAVLAIVDDSAERRALEQPTAESSRVSQKIREAMQSVGNKDRITEVPESGLGRLFLSCAIQDGAVLFAPNGEFLSAGRFVKKTPGVPVTGGARRHAAKSLSRFGVVLAVSQDGAIYLFSEPGGHPSVAPEGLRIH